MYVHRLLTLKYATQNDKRDYSCTLQSFKFDPYYHNSHSNFYSLSRIWFVILWYFRINLCFKNNKIILSFKNPYFSGSPIVFEKCSSCLLQLKGQCNGLLFQRKIKILKKYSLLSEFCIHYNFTAQCSVIRNWYQHVYIQTATFLPSWL